jgi:hypothetical protein
MKRHVGNIVLPNGKKYPIMTDSYSYSVDGFVVRTTSGQRRDVFGCYDVAAAYRYAKSLARKWNAPLPDTKTWKLEYID